MLRYSVSIHAIPTHRGPGSFHVYANVCAYEDTDCAVAMQIWDHDVEHMPEIHSRTLAAEYITEWADIFYQVATQKMAEVKREIESEVNARPGDTSVPS